MSKVPIFSGKTEDYLYWWMRTQAFVGAQGLGEVLKANFQSSLPATEDAVLDETDTSQKAQSTARKQNAKVMNYLVLGMADKKMLNAIEMAKTTDYPSGLAWKVIEVLEKRFKPSDDMAKVERDDALAALRLKKDTDPHDLVDMMSEIQVRYSLPLTEEDRVKTVLRAAKDQYAGVATQLKAVTKLVHQRNPNSDEYIEHIYDNWRAKGNKSGKVDGAKPHETSLGNVSGKTFNGVCYGCGQKGHMKSECPNKKSGYTQKGNGGFHKNKKRFEGTCNICNKVGHKAADCWDNPLNKDKRPPWYGKKNADASGSCVEVLIPFIERDVDRIEKDIGYMNEFHLTSVDSDSSDDDASTEMSAEESSFEFTMEPVDLNGYYQHVPITFNHEYRSGVGPRVLCYPCPDGHGVPPLLRRQLSGNSSVFSSVFSDAESSESGWSTETYDEYSLNSCTASTEYTDGSDSLSEGGFTEGSDPEVGRWVSEGSECREDECPFCDTGHWFEGFLDKVEKAVESDDQTDDGAGRGWNEEVAESESFPVMFDPANSQLYRQDVQGSSLEAEEAAQIVRDEELARYLQMLEEIEAEGQFENDDPMEYGLGSALELSSAEVGNLLRDPEVWIADTGASNHSTWSDDGSFNLRDSGLASQGQWGKAQKMKEIDLRVEFCDKQGGAYLDAKLEGVGLSKSSNYNLLSLTRLLQQGWTIEADKAAIICTKGKAAIKCDIVVKTRKGAIYCARIKRKTNDEVSGASNVVSRTAVPMTMARAHELLGHGHEGSTRATANYLGWKLTDSQLGKCQSCAEAKAKQRNVAKVSPGKKATEPNGRLYHDLARVQAPGDVDGKSRRPNWQMLVDERTGLKLSAFYETKAGIVEPTAQRIVRLGQTTGRPVRIVRQDNAGENKKLEARMQSVPYNQQGVRFEYTARSTPQRNSPVEVAFTHIAGKARAMLNHAQVPRDERYRLFPEVAMTATKLDWLEPVNIDGKIKSRIEHYKGTLPKFVPHMRIFGEAGTVKEGKDGKVGDRGVTMMFVGYADDNAGDTMRMYNPLTRRVVITRDIIWLKRMYWERANTEVTKMDPVVVLDHDDAPDGQYVEMPESDDNSDDENPDSDDETEKDSETLDAEAREGDSDASTWTKVTRTRSGRVVKPVGHYEPSTGKTVKWADETARTRQARSSQNNYYAIMDEIAEEEAAINMEVANTYQEFLNVGAGVGGGFENTAELRPMKYDEAVNGKDGKAWKAEILNEHDRMQKNKVFEVVPRSELPKGVRPIDSTWACKKKSSGKLRGRLNARGFKQVKGEHYDETSIHAPVTQKATINIMHVLSTMANWDRRCIDVSGAFLKGEFTDGEEIYMEVPRGWELLYPGDVVLKLQATIYGLKQSAMAFWREMCKCMRHMDLKRSSADPCLHFIWDEAGDLVLCASWIDDNYITGEEKPADKVCDELQNRFECTDEGEFDEYVGCKVESGPGYMKLTQPVLVQSLEDEFQLPDKKVSTPAVAGSLLASCAEGEEVGPDQHRYFRSGIGKCIHVAGWTKPECSNSVRECARHMHKPSAEHIEAMHRMMQYIRDTRDLGVVLKPERKWDGKKGFLFRVRGRSDSNYATCPETRRSVSGTRTFLEGCPIQWRSVTQKFVTLSVTEAEEAAGVVCVQDMLYTKNILESLELEVELPMVLEMDNKGAVDLVNNWSAGGRTRHVGVRINFLRELKEQGIIEVQWVAGDDNDADIHTKNLGMPAFGKHASVYHRNMGADGSDQA